MSPSFLLRAGTARGSRQEDTDEVESTVQRAGPNAARLLGDKVRQSDSTSTVLGASSVLVITTAWTESAALDAQLAGHGDLHEVFDCRRQLNSTNGAPGARVGHFGVGPDPGAVGDPKQAATRRCRCGAHGTEALHEQARGHRGLVVVGGAGCVFIGGYLVMNLLERGFEKVRAVDLKPIGQWY
ncbi:MAG: hypothetical protein WAV54_13565 [Acidimicrobiales bacterium]